MTMSRSPRQQQSTRAASACPPAQSSHGSVTFVTVARSDILVTITNTNTKSKYISSTITITTTETKSNTKTI